MEQELKDQVNQILQKNPDAVYFSVAAKILNDHPESRYLPWMLAHKMSPEEARVIDALPDSDWRPEIGELKVSHRFAGKLGMDKYEIDAQIMERFFSGDVMADPEHGPVIRPDPVQWMDLQHSPVWRERNGRAYYIVLQLFLEDELAPRMEASTKAAIVGNPDWVNPSGGRIVPPRTLPATMLKTQVSPKKMTAAVLRKALWRLPTLPGGWRRRCSRWWICTMPPRIRCMSRCR